MPARSRVTLNRLLAVLLLLVAAATVATFFAESSWLAELFTHFPLQYLIIAAACGAALAWLGHRRMALLAGTVVAVNLAVLLGSQPFGQRALGFLLEHRSADYAYGHTYNTQVYHIATVATAVAACQPPEGYGP